MINLQHNRLLGITGACSQSLGFQVILGLNLTYCHSPFKVPGTSERGGAFRGFKMCCFGGGSTLLFQFTAAG